MITKTKEIVVYDRDEIGVGDFVHVTWKKDPEASCCGMVTMLSDTRMRVHTVNPVSGDSQNLSLSIEDNEVEVLQKNQVWKNLKRNVDDDDEEDDEEDDEAMMGEDWLDEDDTEEDWPKKKATKKQKCPYCEEVFENCDCVDDEDDDEDDA